MTDSVVEAPCIYPTFRYRDAKKMIEWLQNAFGFTLRARYGEGDEVHHAELALGSSIIMIGQVRDDKFGSMVGEPGASAGKSVYIAVRDADAAFENARAAGAVILEGPVDREYGSREFICRDPEGNVWSFGTYWPKVGQNPL